MLNNSIPKGVQILNYRSAHTQEEVPTLVPNKIMEHLLEGDDDPFYKTEVLDYPTTGTGGIYEKKFFESYINVAKQRPIPGSKRGHEFLSRPHTDFYTVGGKLSSNTDGKSGKVYLKIYIPKNGDGESNAGFIRDAKAGIVNFSLVTIPEYTVKREKDANGNSKEVYYFIASKGGERNDAVEYGMGAMSQVVNEQQEAADLNKSSNGGKVMNKEEIFAALKNLVANNQASLAEIANAIGLGDLVRNETDKQNAETVKQLNGSKPEDILAENKAHKEAFVENKVLSLVGNKIIKLGDGSEKENPSFVYAKNAVSGKSGKELDEAIENLKSDEVFKALNKVLADGDSGINKVINSGQPVDNTVVLTY